MKKRIVIVVLGAKDPEMDRIAEISQKKEGVIVVHAMKDGILVNPANAYEANEDSLVLYMKKGALMENIKQVIFVECNMPALNFIIDKRFMHADHHRPGDTGFSFGPNDFWKASSLGQVYELLNLQNPTSRDNILAAMDHCFNAAANGKCVGVSLEQVLELKFAGIAQETGNTVQDIQVYTRRVVESFGLRWVQDIYPDIFISREIIIKDTLVYVIPDRGVGYNVKYLCAQVAAVIREIPVLIHSHLMEGDLGKFHLCGNASKELVEFFMNYWAQEIGLEKVYGNPDRGYAGAYITKKFAKDFKEYGIESMSKKLIPKN